MTTSDSSGPEVRAAKLFRGMLADVDWLVPVVQAQRQYRDAYYGMTAAALLEDLFFDSTFNYAARHHPDVQLSKCARGALGDYAIQGTEFSHKNVEGPTALAVHWDATVASVPTWTSPTPMVIVSAAHSRLTGTFTPRGGASVPARAGYPGPGATPSRKVWALVIWTPDGSASIMRTWPQFPEWCEVWPVAALAMRTGFGANDLDLVLLQDSVREHEEGVLDIGLRPGVYVLGSEHLTDVPVSKNNRGTIVKPDGLAGLLRLAAAEGLVANMPMWAAHFAAGRPPDLYLAQRAEYDRRFSPVREARGAISLAERHLQMIMEQD